MRHEALSVMSAHYHFANKKAKQKNIIAPKVEFTLGKNTHGKAKKQNVSLSWSLFRSYFPAHVGRERESNASVSSKMESKHGILRDLQVNQPFQNNRTRKRILYLSIDFIPGVKTLISIQS